MPPQSIELHDLQKRAVTFDKRLDQLKNDLASREIPWYPYRTLLTFSVLDTLLTGPRRNFLGLAGIDTILDVGCADGANSFFLESMGCRVHAVDHWRINHSQLRGFNALHAALNSSVLFEEVDLDTQFRLREERYGLALFLGVLYHLKNPFYVLEALARQAHYCLLSTRIAQRTSQGNPMAKEPLAYLLDPRECNNDATNHWIFSETALRRLFDQTGWTVHDFITAGYKRGSEPARLDRDERAFCLLESRVWRTFSVQLLRGWHALEEETFRWTERRFSVEVHPSASLKFSKFRLIFLLPTPGPVTVSASVNGGAPSAATFLEEREHSYEIEIPEAPSAGTPICIDFTVDRSVSPANGDGRELGLIVSFWQPGLEGPDPILPFDLT